MPAIPTYLLHQLLFYSHLVSELFSSCFGSKLAFYELFGSKYRWFADSVLSCHHLALATCVEHLKKLTNFQTHAKENANTLTHIFAFSLSARLTPKALNLLFMEILMTYVKPLWCCKHRPFQTSNLKKCGLFLWEIRKLTPCFDLLFYKCSNWLWLSHILGKLKPTFWTTIHSRQLPRWELLCLRHQVDYRWCIL
jgi:hypothetical protein